MRIPLDEDRHQHHRGVKLPDRTKLVARGSRWGNPWPIGSTTRVPGTGEQTVTVTRDVSLALYRQYATERLKRQPDWLEPLKGYRLACWCGTDQHCHADILAVMVRWGWFTDEKVPA